MGVLSQKRLLPLRIYDALLLMAEGKPFCLMKHYFSSSIRVVEWSLIFFFGLGNYHEKKNH